MQFIAKCFAAFQRRAAIAAGVLSVFSILGAASPAGAEDAPEANGPPAARPVIFLDQGRGSGIWVETHMSYSPLRREMARQAFLVAAREELGWRTQDAWLEERPHENERTPRFELKQMARVPLTNNIEILTIEGEEKKSQEKIPFEKDVNIDYAPLLELCERWSREKFPEVILRITEGERYPRPAWGAAPLPNDAAERLDRMSFHAQFAAVRTIHNTIAREGESPELLGGLIRGYAHLGLLNEGQWNASHKVYHARALVYAQRWLARDPQSPAARWHRAYAMAAAGLLHAAMSDLEAANAQWRGLAENDRPAAPDWLPLLTAFVEFDVEKLKIDESDRRAELAALLLFISYHQAAAYDSAIRHGLKSLEIVPECYRMQEEMLEISGVALWHDLTVRAPEVFAQTVYKRAVEMPGIPAGVSEIAKPLAGGRAGAREPAVRKQLVAALRAADKGEAEGRPADDAREPGWSALAQWMDDTTFLHVMRRTHFLSARLATDPTGYINSAMPLLEGHRHAPMIDTYRLDAESRRSVPERLQKVTLLELDLRARKFYEYFEGKDAQKHYHFWDAMSRNMDDTANDMLVIMKIPSYVHIAQHAERLQKISPRSPLALGILIETRWDDYKDRVDEWEKMSRQHPRIGRSLANVYYLRQEYEQAEKYTRAIIEMEPAYTNYSLLASIYQRQGEFEKYRETYDEYLRTQPDFELNHARARNRVAWVYIRLEEWDKALPYASGAAQSGAGWAMRTLAIVCEGLGKYDDAELLYRAMAQRYGEQDYVHWYFFCRRTGRGDEAAARAAWERYVRRLPEQLAGDRVFAVGMTYFVDGKDAEALAVFERGFNANHSPQSGIFAALIADRLKKHDLRDQLLEAVKERGARDIDRVTGKPHQNLIDLAAFFAADLKKGGNAEFDFADAEQICKSGKDYDVNTAAFFVGEYLAQRGKPDGAQRFWLYAADEPAPGVMYYELASFRLREAGLETKDYAELRKKLDVTDRWVIPN